MTITPKEKAKELVYKFENLVTVWDCYNDEPLEIECRLSDMKECALICAEEILRSKENTWTITLEYWKEVKEEIIKL